MACRGGGELRWTVVAVVVVEIKEEKMEVKEREIVEKNINEVRQKIKIIINMHKLKL